MSDSPAFQLLHEGVRQRIYKMGWTELHAMQVQAINRILGTQGHIVISAGTASGKTEAAFLPIVSAIADDPVGSIRVIYVGPLKALINDQFGRVEELCSQMNVPVHRWHGDVAANAKVKLITQPGGILLITPESLESIFVNRSSSLRKLFQGLRFVVIDELHSFLDNERGRHLRSLLYRVAHRCESPPRLIGLSATIGTPSAAKEYLDRDRPEDVYFLLGEQAESELKLRLHAYVEKMREDETADADDTPGQPSRLAEDIVTHCRGYTNLVFGNARSDVERFADLCQRIAAVEGVPDLFLVHHGSLSADLRHEAEQVMKESSKNLRPVTTFCSSTLEMGIDIGSVRMVGQIGAPHSVASLKQRVGRSGRRQGEPRILRGYLECRSIDEKSDLFDRLHLRLIQNVAVIELLLRNWTEPCESSTFDLSTLTQQIISLISENGSVTAQDAFDVLCKHGAFRAVQPPEFAKLLRRLGCVDVIEQCVDGSLILGLMGEDIRKDKSFYAAFMTADAFAVFHDSERIGAVDYPPEIKQHMILGGRRWEVVDVDDRQHTVYVIPASGRKAAIFAGRGGALHATIVKEMHRILQSRDKYVYLNEVAAQLVEDARGTASAARFCSDRFVSLGRNQTAFLPWEGTRTLDTIRALVEASGIEAKIEEEIALTVPLDIPACKRALRGLAEKPPPEPQIIDALSGPPMAKYSYLLDVELTREVCKYQWLDVERAIRAVLID